MLSNRNKIGHLSLTFSRFTVSVVLLVTTEEAIFCFFEVGVLLLIKERESYQARSRKMEAMDHKEKIRTVFCCCCCALLPPEWHRIRLFRVF